MVNRIPLASEEKIYNRIAVLRTERSLSRQALADVVGVNYQTIGYLERGDYYPSLALAFRLSDEFQVPIEMIFSRKPMEPLSLVQANGSFNHESRMK